MSIDNPTVKLANYSFSVNTSNPNLRGHLERTHAHEYMRMVEEGKWRNQLPSRKQIEVNNVPTRQPFSRAAFLRCLVNFIVADDQVRPTRINCVFLIHVFYLVY
jgi:hypothetical protein